MNYKSPTNYEVHLKVKLSRYKDDLYTTVLRHIDQAKIGVGWRYIVSNAILDKPLIRTLIYKSNLQLLWEQEIGVQISVPQYLINTISLLLSIKSYLYIVM